MELFVINRHEGDEQPEENKTTEDEEKKLKRVLKRIEKRKRAKERFKEKLQLQNEKKTHAIEERLRKKQVKASIVAVPKTTEDEFIDANIKEAEAKEEIEKNQKSSKEFSGNMEGFTVLGGENFSKKEKVKRVLPKWLSHPTVISVNLQDLQAKVSSMKCLDKSLRAKLKANGIKKLFPVQAAVIPWLLEANGAADVIMPPDICVSAPTGSGKTLAFVLPIVQALKQSTVKRISALAILPTQDLASQVYNTFKEYVEGTDLDVCLVTGNVPFAVEQKKLVAENPAFGYISKVDILVCTAGRLVDHIKHTKGFDLHHLRFLVIDEADRVLETIQNDWLYHLENHIQSNSVDQGNVVLNIFTLQKPRPPQKLLFSATLSQDPEKLQRLSLFQPKLFTSVVENTESDQQIEAAPSVFVGKYTTPKELTEKYMVCSLDLKPLVLYKLIENEKLTKTLIFTNSAESVHRLAILLRSLFAERLKVEEISANLEMKTRNAVLKNFSEEKIDLLVCTDSLARGMDFSGVQCVISYSAPKHLKTYIHRAGRTARAGAFGLAITMLHNNSQVAHFLGLLKQAGKNNLSEIKVAEDDLDDLGKQYEDALSNLKQSILDEKKDDIKKIKLSKLNRKQNTRKK